MVHDLFEAEVARLDRTRRRDDVPSRTATRNMVERRETAGDRIRFIERGRHGRDQADVLSDCGKRPQQRAGLELSGVIGSGERLPALDIGITHGIARKIDVQLSLLGLLRQPGKVAEVMLIERAFPGIAPASWVRTAVVNESCQN